MARRTYNGLRASGVMLNEGGYRIMENVPSWYNGFTMKTDGNAISHRVRMCQYLGVDRLPDNYEVHHVDGIRFNNRKRNLMLIHKVAHKKLHAEMKLIGGRHLTRDEQQQLLELLGFTDITSAEGCVEKDNKCSILSRCVAHALH